MQVDASDPHAIQAADVLRRAGIDRPWQALEEIVGADDPAEARGVLHRYGLSDKLAGEVLDRIGAIQGEPAAAALLEPSGVEDETNAQFGADGANPVPPVVDGDQGPNTSESAERTEADGPGETQQTGEVANGTTESGGRSGAPADAGV